MKGALFTIGYEGRSQGEYLALLRRAGVTLLVDVRATPRSRKKGFSKGTLAQGCADAGIRYEHLPELGIASERRKQATTHAGFQTMFAEYERELLPRRGAAVEKVEAWLKDGEHVALTCFEHAASECHRHYVANALKERFKGKLDVKDL
jgi:uncharacterized protein (DUF488 family)